MEGVAASERARAELDRPPALVLLVAFNERQVRIESEGVPVEDADWAGLIEGVMLPRLQAARHGTAIRSGVTAIGHRLEGGRHSVVSDPFARAKALRDVCLVLVAAGLASMAASGRPVRTVGARW